MMLSKAGIDFQDIRISDMSEVKEMRDKEMLQYGQLPMVELRSGDKLVQTKAINNFIAYKHGFVPKSSYKRYYGEQVLESL
jgi:glutathione S-transferase